MVRTILTWRVLGENLVGTCHVPTPGRAGGLSGAPSVGVLLLNSGSAPRSGNSDLAVRIGHRLALRGFPVFRFDLPGLGDSSGSTPVDLDAYWNAVVNGRNDEATAALIDRIHLEFGVARVIVGGLCAAALPTIRALDHSGSTPAGLILLEPNFRRALQAEPDAARPAAGITAFAKRAGVLSRTFSVLDRNQDSRIMRAAAPLRALLSALKRHAGFLLPRDVNVALVSRWQQSFACGIHSLVVVAEGQGTDRYVTRILESMPLRPLGMVSIVRVPETNHLFTSGGGRDAVLDALEHWVLEHFGGIVEPFVRLKSGS